VESTKEPVEQDAGGVLPEPTFFLFYFFKKTHYTYATPSRVMVSPPKT